MDKYKYKYALKYDINYHNSIHSILFIIQQMGGKVNQYNLLKILFAADKYHLNSCRRPITGDIYIKETNGTVPKEIYYDILLGNNLTPCLRVLGQDRLPFEITTAGKDTIISSIQLPDDAYFSVKSKRYLNQAIEDYGNLSVAGARKKNHQESCWIETPLNEQIPFEFMADNEENLEFLLEHPFGIVV